MIDTGKLDEACEGLVKSDCDPSELVDKLQAVLLTKVSVCKPLKEPVAPAMTELNDFIPVYHTCLQGQVSTRAGGKYGTSLEAPLGPNIRLII